MIPVSKIVKFVIGVLSLLCSFLGEDSSDVINSNTDKK